MPVPRPALLPPSEQPHPSPTPPPAAHPRAHLRHRTQRWRQSRLRRWSVHRQRRMAGPPASDEWCAGRSMAISVPRSRLRSRPPPACRAVRTTVSMRWACARLRCAAPPTESLPALQLSVGHRSELSPPSSAGHRSGSLCWRELVARSCRHLPRPSKRLSHQRRRATSRCAWARYAQCLGHRRRRLLRATPRRTSQAAAARQLGAHLPR